MVRSDQQWRCPQGHCFDIARQGYINLLPVQHKKSRDPGDSKEMVKARMQFLDSGLYQPIATAINALIRNNLSQHHGDSNPLQLLDAGCGEGYYLNTLATALDQDGHYIRATGLDISKWALRSCLQRNRQLNGIVASNRRIPLLDNSQDIVLCAFGFPVYEEFARLLRPGGLYLQIDSGSNHLLEMRQQLYSDLRRSEEPALTAAQQSIGPLLSEQRVELQTRPLQRAELEQLLQMTPHNYRATPAARLQLLDAAPLALSIDVILRLHCHHPATGNE